MQENNKAVQVDADYGSKQYEGFKQRYEGYMARAAEERKQAGLISNLRLAVFVSGTALGILLFVVLGLQYGIIAIAAALAIFVFLVVRHGRLSQALKRTECKAEVNRMFMDRMKSGWEDFEDNGLEFADPLHRYSDDLDIFGPKSLYQWISTAHTHYGRRELRRLFADPDKAPKSIAMRQDAIRELAQKGDFCENLQSEGMLSGRTADDPEKLLAYVEDDTTRFKKSRDH